MIDWLIDWFNFFQHKKKKKFFFSNAAIEFFFRLSGFSAIRFIWFIIYTKRSKEFKKKNFMAAVNIALSKIAKPLHQRKKWCPYSFLSKLTAFELDKDWNQSTNSSDKSYCLDVWGSHKYWLLDTTLIFFKIVFLIRIASKVQEHLCYKKKRKSKFFFKKKNKKKQILRNFVLLDNPVHNPRNYLNNFRSLLGESNYGNWDTFRSNRPWCSWFDSTTSNLGNTAQVGYSKHH